MRKIALLVFLPFLLVVGGFAVLLLSSGRAPITLEPDCGLSVAPDLAGEMTTDPDAGKWTIYAWDGTGAAPDVRIKERSAEDLKGPRGAGRGCELDVRELSPEGTTGADWRIGRVLDPAALRGKTVRVSFFLRADEPATLPAGTVYVYDGKSVGGLPLKSLESEWSTHRIEYAAPQDPRTFEIWFRVFFDSPAAEPERNSLFMSVALDVVGPDAPMSEVEKIYANPAYQRVICPTTIPADTQETIGTRSRTDEWLVYSYGKESNPPEVLVAPLQGDTPACRLFVTKAPTEPGVDVDWRLGRVMEVEALRGEKDRFEADLSADRQTDLSDAYLYIYDGTNLVRENVASLGPDPQTFAVEHQLPEDASTLQIWLRLALGASTIRPEETNVDFAPRFERIALP